MTTTGMTHMGWISKSRRTAGLLALAALCLCGSLARAEDARRRFNIPAGKADQRLNELIADLGLSILCDFRATGVETTNAVRGVYTLKEALEKMAKGKNIQFWFPTEKTVACGPREKAKPETTVVQRQPSRLAAEPPKSEPLPEVTVTGTHIRGESPIGSQRLTITRQDIDRSGLATVADSIRTLPQNFDGGPTEDTREIGRETRTNAGMGTSLNLRGIGPGETLVLVNGRRLVPGGAEGAFIDVSSIPLTAVERIDVLPDSGSALYGTDAIGGVIDIVLRHDYSGAESQARVGSTTQGGPDEYRFGQVLGKRWDEGNAMLLMELYRRDALAHADRPQAKSDLRRFGGQNFDVPQSNPGTLIAGGRMWAIPSGQDGRDLEPTDFEENTSNLSDRYDGGDLYPSQRRWSALASGRRTLRPNLQVFADGLFSRRDARQQFPGTRTTLPVFDINPYYVNPADVDPADGNDPVFVSYDFTDDLGPLRTAATVKTSNIALGANLDTAANWRWSGHLGYAQEKLEARSTGQVNFAALIEALSDRSLETAFNPFGDGSHTHPDTLESIRASSFFSSSSTIKSFNVRGDGALARLPGGDLKLAFGADYRDQRLSAELQDVNAGPDPNTPLGRAATAIFSELLVPLAPLENPRRALRELTLSLAVRHESHSDVGSATAPKVGLRWSPFADLALRGTWTEAFRAPNLADLYEGANSSGVFAVLDPNSPTLVSQTLVWAGRNRDLRAESAQSWTLGADLGPQWLGGWSVAMTYFNMQVRNRFIENPFTLDALTNARFEDLIIRNPTDEQHEIVCDRSRFAGGDCLNTPIDIIVDARLSNSAFMTTSGLDLAGHREFATGHGRFDAELNGTYLFRYAERETVDSPIRELVDTAHHPLRLHLRGSLSWQRQGFGATAFLNYDGAYRDTESNPQRKVAAWQTWDLQLRYESDARSRLGAMSFFVNVQNLLDEEPPFLNNQLGFGYDAENADLLGRAVSFEVRRKW